MATQLSEPELDQAIGQELCKGPRSFVSKYINPVPTNEARYQEFRDLLDPDPIEHSFIVTEGLGIRWGIVAKFKDPGSKQCTTEV